MATLWDKAAGIWLLANGSLDDLSGNANVLTERGSTAGIVVGLEGKQNAARRNLRATPDYADIADGTQTGLDITGSIALFGKVILNSTGVFQQMQGKWHTSGQFAYVFSVNASDKFEVSLSNDGTTVNTATGATSLVADTPYKLLAVYNGTDIRLYIDNVLDSNGASNPLTYSSGIFNGTDDFAIGANGIGSNSSNMDMHDFAVFDDALDSTERGVLDSLIDNFKFSGTLSGTIKDRTGTTVDCSSFNVELVVNDINNATAAVATQTITSADGTWSVAGLEVGKRYLVSTWFVGSFTPLSATDVGGAEYMTAEFPA